MLVLTSLSWVWGTFHLSSDFQLEYILHLDIAVLLGSVGGDKKSGDWCESWVIYIYIYMNDPLVIIVHIP